jgi:GNAT superfamily N-acetyltransferase
MFNVRITTTTNGVDWNELADIFPRAPLGTRQPEKLAIRFSNSYAVSFAYDGDVLIGAARAISDGDQHAAIYDVVLLPEYQKHGIGRQLMKSLLDQLSNIEAIILYAVPGKEGFYQQFGFGKMPTAMGLFHNADFMRKYKMLE